MLVFELMLFDILLFVCSMVILVLFFDFEDPCPCF